MYFWIIILLVYALISFFIDLGKLPFVLRHVWNILPFALGMYLIYRTKMKQRVGYVETLESKIEKLADRYENLRYSKVVEKLEALEARLAKLEKKK
jgi:hypothetical protein